MLVWYGSQQQISTWYKQWYEGPYQPGQNSATRVDTSVNRMHDFTCQGDIHTRLVLGLDLFIRLGFVKTYQVMSAVCQDSLL